MTQRAVVYNTRSTGRIGFIGPGSPALEGRAVAPGKHPWSVCGAGFNSRRLVTVQIARGVI